MKAVLGIALLILAVAGLVFFAMQARQGLKAGGGAQLTGVHWQAVRIDDEALPEDVDLQIQFDVDGSIKGHSGCNRFFGSLQKSESGIEVSPLGSTRMACPEPVMNRETAFLDAVQKMKDFRIGDSEMSLLDEDGNVLASFVADPGR